jgi:hypothetical protein
MSPGQVRHRELKQPGEEALGVDCIEHAGCDDAVTAQPRHERQCLAMAVQHFPDQPPAFGGTSMQAGHVRFRPCLVDEDQPFRGDLVLMALPLPPATRDISAVLFAGA